MNRDIPKDEEFEELIAMLKGYRKGNGELVSLKRLKDVARVGKIMKDLTRGGDVTVSYSLEHLDAGLISVNLEGKEIEIFSPSAFQKAVKLASNFEIFPLTNGMVQMTFGFYGLVKDEGGY